VDNLRTLWVLFGWLGLLMVLVELTPLQRYLRGWGPDLLGAWLLVFLVFAGVSAVWGYYFPLLLGALSITGAVLVRWRFER